VVATLKIDNNKKTVQRFRIKVLPTFLLFRDGAQVHRLENLTGKKYLASVLTDYMKK
jgi:thioredoxin-like negative regulator of GroEL